MTSETHKGPTPAGGVRSEIFYRDDAGNPVDKEQATRAEIVEFDRRRQRHHAHLWPAGSYGSAEAKMKYARLIPP